MDNEAESTPEYQDKSECMDENAVPNGPVICDKDDTQPTARVINIVLHAPDVVQVQEASKDPTAEVALAAIQALSAICHRQLDELGVDREGRDKKRAPLY